MNVVARYGSASIPGSIAGVVLPPLFFLPLIQSGDAPTHFIFDVHARDWLFLVVGYCAALYLVWICGAVLFRVLFCGASAVWIDRGKVHTFAWTANCDDVQEVAYRPGQRAFLIKVDLVEFRLKDGHSKQIGAGILRGDPSQIVEDIRNGLRRPA